MAGIASPAMDKLRAQLEGMSPMQLAQIARSNPGDLPLLGLLHTEGVRRQRLAAPAPQPQEQPPVAEQLPDQLMQLPEDTGIARLPVGDMNYADGGIIGYAGGGGPGLKEYMENYNALIGAGASDEESDIQNRFNPRRIIAEEYLDKLNAMQAERQANMPARTAMAAAQERLAAEAARDPEAIREAKNMALIRAGLGMMAGRSPYAMQNIATGATSGLDALAQSKSEIRKRGREREEILTKLQIADEATKRGDYDEAFKARQEAAKLGYDMRVAEITAREAQAERDRTRAAKGAETLAEQAGATSRTERQIEANKELTELRIQAERELTELRIDADARIAQLNAQGAKADALQVRNMKAVVDAAEKRLKLLNDAPAKDLASPEHRKKIQDAEKDLNAASAQLRALVYASLGVDLPAAAPAPAPATAPAPGAAPARAPVRSANRPLGPEVLSNEQLGAAINTPELQRILNMYKTPQGR